MVTLFSLEMYNEPKTRSKYIRAKNLIRKNIFTISTVKLNQLINLIIHQIFSIARDWSKRVT